MLIDFLKNLLILMNNISDIQLDIVNVFLAIFAGLSALIAILGFYFSRKDLEKEREFARENLIIQLNYDETKKIFSYFNNELRDIYNVYFELEKNNNKFLLSSKDYLILMYLVKVFRKFTNPYMPKRILDSWEDFYMKKHEINNVNIKEFFKILNNTKNNESELINSKNMVYI